MTSITLPYDIAMYTGSSYAAIVGTTAITEPYALVKFGTNQGEVIITAAGGESACGIICEQGVSASNTLAVGDRVTVFTSGHVWAVAAGALATIGTTVGSAAGGRVTTFSATAPVVGRTFGTAAGAGELLPILLDLSQS